MKNLKQVYFHAKNKKKQQIKFNTLHVLFGLSLSALRCLNLFNLSLFHFSWKLFTMTAIEPEGAKQKVPQTAQQCDQIV